MLALREERTRLSPTSNTEQAGFSLIEVAVALAVLSIVVLGVLGGITNASFAQRNTQAEVQSQQLLDRVLEETQAIDFDGLLGFNGTFVTQGDHRADLTVLLLQPNLIQIQVDVTSTAFPDVNNVGVVLVADPD